MLKLDLFVYDEQGLKVNGLCVENAAPQQINAVLMFLKAGWNFVVNCSKNDVVPEKKS